ncbi:MAG: hypothetical protein F6K23_27720 [Okeania sp. SIO2C9]|uniref:hypothetical protein n=1 Tax=Okeania sp. SIO2C9 TaxID=2607791 RepID=UPI0013BFF60D|nr:hypothetical protein [Okeania sp. SIO2C9]NEQ76490.1 hypothetical protein [Okeania sp. SIO2C9]
MTQFNSATKYATDPFSKIDPPRVVLDQFASQALVKMQEDLAQKVEPDLAISEPTRQDISDYLKQKIREKGISENNIYDLSERLDQTVLDDISRLLLSNTFIYLVIIKEALYEEVSNIEVSNILDQTALYNAVLRKAHDVHRKWFLARLLAEVFDARHIAINASSPRWQKLDDLTLGRTIPIAEGKVEPAVMDILSTLYQKGDLPHYLQLYIDERSNIPKHLFTPSIQESIIDYLMKLGLEIQDKQEFKDGKYDEYFALAYSEALKYTTVSEDPIDMALKKGGKVDWDFSVDVFDATEEQGVIPANIKATGALDYVYYIGEGMRVFDVANALVLRWASGALDIPEGDAAAALYRFHKRRSDRSTPEERAMLYKRVLNRGNGQLLSSMMPNTAFPRYWHALMSEVTQYISKKEGTGTGDYQPSRSQLYQAVKNLQYNLTEYMTGMAHLQVTEDYAHLQEAIDLVKMEEIINHFGGRRKSLWNVIESVAKQDLGVTVQTSVMRDLAVEGNKVYQWVADFNEAIVREEEFKNFLKAAEAWIIAQASLEEANGFAPNGKGQDNFGDFNDDFNDDFDDDFDDW